MAKKRKIKKNGQEKLREGKILVVDNEEGICNILKKLLEGQGYQVTSTQKGREAVNFCSKNKYDLAIIDMVMPELSGLQVFKEIKKIDNRARAIFITGKPLDRHIAHELAAGPYLYFKKPFKLDELIKVVNRTLAR